MNRALARYLPAPVLFNLGLFIHVLLFNLYLADLGYREDFMGRQSALMTIGTAAGILAGAFVTRRRGLRFTGIAACAGVTLALILRANAVPPFMDYASVALGLCLGMWHVTNTPAIASFSLGATGFSLNIGLSIAVGALGGLIGGHLPAWLGALPGSQVMPAAELKRQALMFAAIPVVAAGAIVASIRFPQSPPDSNSGFAASRKFLWRYLPAVGLWYAFCAGFIPFFNAYLRFRMHASSEAIGGVYAITHLPQAAATLLMPWIVARLGLVRSITATQFAAALGVAAMWFVASVPQAAIVYMIYISLQVMSEPGLHGMLMRGVPAAERSAAMAANLLLLFAINAAVDTGAGRLIVSRGYGALFITLSVTGIIAAFLFAAIFRRESRDAPATPASATQNSGVQQE